MNGIPTDEEMAQNTWEYEASYDVVRYAMKLFKKGDGTGKLQGLKNVIYNAHCFLQDELEYMEEEAKDLGLDKWIAEDEAEREMAEDEERIHKEEETNHFISCLREFQISARAYLTMYGQQAARRAIQEIPGAVKDLSKFVEMVDKVVDDDQ